MFHWNLNWICRKLLSLEVMRGSRRREDFSQNIPCYVINPRPASCHNDSFLLVYQLDGTRAYCLKNEDCQLTSIVSLVFSESGCSFIIVKNWRQWSLLNSGDSTITTLCEPPWRLAPFVTLKWMVSTGSFSRGLACSSIARLVVNHWPLMKQVLTDNKKKSVTAGRDTPLPNSWRCSWWTLNGNSTFC